MRTVRNITVAVEPELYRQTRKIAADYDTTVTDMVRFLLLALPEAVKAAHNLAWQQRAPRPRPHPQPPTSTPPAPRSQKKTELRPVRLSTPIILFPFSNLPPIPPRPHRISLSVSRAECHHFKSLTHISSIAHFNRCTPVKTLRAGGP